MALITTESTRIVIGCAIRVHRKLGPGLLESVYETCLAEEMIRAKLQFATQPRLPVRYDGRLLEKAFIPDFLVEYELVVEVKSAEFILPVHRSQVLTYMKLAGVKKGLLINFNVPMLKHGLTSLVR